MTDYLLEKAGGLGVPKVALPIFMLGGFRQRTLAHAARRGCGRKAHGAKSSLASRADAGCRLTCAVCWPTSLASPAKRSNGTRFTARKKMLPGNGLKSRLDKPEGFEAVVAAAAMLNRGEFDALIHPGGHGFFSCSAVTR